MHIRRFHLVHCVGCSIKKIGAVMSYGCDMLLLKENVMGIRMTLLLEDCIKPLMGWGLENGG